MQINFNHVASALGLIALGVGLGMAYSRHLSAKAAAANTTPSMFSVQPLWTYGGNWSGE